MRMLFRAEEAIISIAECQAVRVSLTRPSPVSFTGEGFGEQPEDNSLSTRISASSGMMGFLPL